MSPRLPTGNPPGRPPRPYTVTRFLVYVKPATKAWFERHAATRGLTVTALVEEILEGYRKRSTRKR